MRFISRITGFAAAMIALLCGVVSDSKVDAILDIGCTHAKCINGCGSWGDEQACAGTCTYYPMEPPYTDDLPDDVDYYSCAKLYLETAQNVVVYSCSPAKSSESGKIWCNESSFLPQEEKKCLNMHFCWCPQPDNYFDNYCIEDPNSGEYIACMPVDVSCGRRHIAVPDVGDTDDCQPTCLSCCMQGDCS